MSIKVPISIGELWDKYSILLIKNEKIDDSEKLKHVSKEIQFLDDLMKQFSYNKSELFTNLKKINEELWVIEDKLRIKEKNKEFDSEFIELARSVYYTNDKRAELKKEINILYNSIIFETKHYIEYN